MDFLARQTWANLSEAAFADRWQAYVATGALGATCPKVGIAFFSYPSLGDRKLRGAVARADIAKGERFCEMPVRSLLSELTVGNSTLKPLADAIDAEAASAVGGRARNRARSLDRRSLVAMLILRESAKTRSPLMPYMAVLHTHDVTSVPLTWPLGSPQLANASPYLRSLAAQSRSTALRNYETLVPLALTRFPQLLSEGLPCGTSRTSTGSLLQTATSSCPRARLDAVYSREEFLRVFAILAARDWYLPVYGTSRAFCVPIVDMFNFGQVGIRAEFDDKRHAFVATAAWPIRKGTELLFYYGSFCKEQWVNMYGFAPGETKSCETSGARAPSNYGPKAKGSRALLSKMEAKEAGMSPADAAIKAAKLALAKAKRLKALELMRDASAIEAAE